MEIANRLGIRYEEVIHVLNDHGIKPTLRLPYSGGYGISEEAFLGLEARLNGYTQDVPSPLPDSGGIVLAESCPV
jgi:hypothetical protein